MNTVICPSYSTNSEALLKLAPNIRLFVGTVKLEDNGFSSIVVGATIHIWKDA